MFVKTQKFLILGASKSGSAVANYLLSKGSKCYVYEELKTEKVQASVNQLVSLGAQVVDDANIDEALKKVDAIIISPGIAINHRIAVKAKNLGIKRYFPTLPVFFYMDSFFSAIKKKILCTMKQFDRERKAAVVVVHGIYLYLFLIES